MAANAPNAPIQSAGTSRRLPAGDVHRFWSEVESELINEHRLGQERALRGILRYRDEVEHLGPIVYHQRPDEIARTIAESGYTDVAHPAGAVRQGA